MATGFSDEPEVEGQVVDAGNLHGQEFLGLEEVVEIGSGVEGVHGCRAVGVDGCEVGFPLLVAEVHDAFGGEEHGVAAVAGGHDAVKHVHAPFYAFEQIGRCAHSHEVAGAVLGKDVVDHFYHLVHHFGWFAHGQSAYGVAVGPFLGHELCRLASQVGVGASLHDGEETLVVAILGLGLVESLPAAVQPAVGQSQALLGIVVVAGARGTLVEGHHDVGSDAALDVHHAFGREEVARAVDVTLEVAALLLQLAYAREGEDLESARVSEHGAVPVDEAVESASLFKYVGAGAQVEVVGVAQDNLSSHFLLQVALQYALHAAHRAYGHEYGGFHLSVVGGDDSGTGAGLIVGL